MLPTLSREGLLYVKETNKTVTIKCSHADGFFILLTAIVTYQKSIFRFHAAKWQRRFRLTADTQKPCREHLFMPFHKLWNIVFHIVSLKWYRIMGRINLKKGKMLVWRLSTELDTNMMDKKGGWEIWFLSTHLNKKLCKKCLWGEWMLWLIFHQAT